MTPSPFEQLKRRVKTHAFACDDILRDVEEDGTKALYNIDFSVLHPMMSPTMLGTRAITNSDDFDAVSYEALSLAQRYPKTGFQFVMSFPAFIEMLDHLDRRLSNLNVLKENANEVKTAFDELTSYRAVLDAGRIDERDLIQSRAIKQRLTKLITRLPNANEGRQMATMLALVNTKVIRGIGDFYTNDDIEAARNGRKFYREILGRIDYFRGGATPPPGEEGDFHRKIDAWNIVLSKQLHDVKDNQRVMFLGPNKLRHIYERQEEVLSRNIVAPYLRLKTLSMASSSQDIHLESVNRIEKLLRRCMEAWEDLQDADDIDQLFTAQIETITEAQRMLNTVYGANPEEVQMAEEERRRLISQLLKNPTSLRELAAENEEQVRRDAEALIAIAPEPLSDDVLEAYDIKDNKRIKQIMKRFKAA